MKAQYVAPFAIIQDKDGYVNVRASPSIKAKVIDTLHNNHVFEDQVQFGENTKNWIYVTYGSNYNKKTQKFEEKSGYIYANRILYLQKLPQFKKVVIDKQNVEFSNSGIKLNMRFGKFEPTLHKVEKVPYEYVSKVDGETPWGTDGILPESLTEIKEIKLTTNSSEFSFPNKSLIGIFQPNISNMYVSTNGDTIFIVMSNADAGGSYNIVWTIRNNQIIDRFINRDF